MGSHAQYIPGNFCIAVSSQTKHVYVQSKHCVIDVSNNSGGKLGCAKVWLNLWQNAELDAELSSVALEVSSRAN